MTSAERKRQIRTNRRKLGLCLECTEKALPNNCRCEFHRVDHLTKLKVSRNALRKSWKIENRCSRCGSLLNIEMDGIFIRCLNCRIEAKLPFKRSDFKF